jgi:hypothetical protein
MPNTFSPPNICPAVLTSLSDNLINNPANINVFGGTLAALNDPANTGAGRIIRDANDDGTGHTKEVRVVYKQRLLPSAVVDEFDCSVGDELPYIEQVVTVDKYKAINFSMTEATVRQLCASYSELVRLTGSDIPSMIVARANEIGAAQGALSVAREIFGDFTLASNALIQAVNIELLSSLAGGRGTLAGGTTAAVDYEVLGINGEINAQGLFKMKQDYIKTGLNGAPIIIGGAGPLHQIWMNDSRYFGQGANGINFSTVRDNTGIAQFYYDQNAANQFGAESNGIIIAPGSAVYTPFLQYVGNFGKIGTTERFTMPLPQLPTVKCDVRIQPIECGTNANSYSVWMEMYFDVYTPPVAMFPDGDSLEGVNGLYLADFLTVTP